MAMYEIEKGIIVDEIEGLLEGINKYSSFEIQSLETVFTFIREEYHTKFFIDRKMNINMAEDKDTTYLWLDTGMRTVQDEPIFISLLKNEEGYSGHYVGTTNILSNAVRDFSPWNSKDIAANKKKMKQKYQSRTAKRETLYIENENEYLLKKMNVNRSINSLADVVDWCSIACPEIEEQGETLQNNADEKTELKIVEFPQTTCRDFEGTKIILDLEFTAVDENNKDMHRLAKFEIIQFGAVKLNSKNEIIGKYDSYVRPRFCSCIDPKVAKLTGITDEMVSEAPDFINVVNGFLGWVGDTKTILSWSMDDFRVLRNECRQKGLIDGRLDILFDNWIDLQKMFGDEIGVEKQVSLENAIAGLELEFEGNKHTALDDAINTATIFQIMQKEENLKDRYKDIVERFATSEELSVSIGSLFGDLLKEINEA